MNLQKYEYKEKLISVSIPEQYKKDIADFLLCLRLSDLMENESFDETDKKRIIDNTKWEDPIMAYDLSEVISKMSAIARDRSNGAAPLYKLLVSRELYKELCDRYRISETTKIIINRIEIQKSVDIVYNFGVLGLCKPKFKFVNPEMLTIAGKVANAS